MTTFVTITSVKIPSIVRLSYVGDDNFFVAPVYSSGKEGLSWANEIGSWQGVIFQEASSSPIVAFTVQDDWYLESSDFFS